MLTSLLIRKNVDRDFINTSVIIIIMLHKKEQPFWLEISCKFPHKPEIYFKQSAVCDLTNVNLVHACKKSDINLGNASQ